MPSYSWSESTGKYKYNLAYTNKDEQFKTVSANYLIVSPGTTLTTGTKTVQGTQIPANGITVKCENDARIFRYNSERDMLMYYPSTEIKNTWSTVGNDGDYKCTNNSEYGKGSAYSSNTFNMTAKPTDGSTIKCSDDNNNYYRYDESGNIINKYNTNAIAAQYGAIAPMVIQSGELDISTGTTTFAAAPTIDYTKPVSYTFYFECCIEKTHGNWRNIMNHGTQEWPVSNDGRRPGIYINNNNNIQITHSTDSDANANILSGFKATNGRWFACCFIVNRYTMTSYFQDVASSGTTTLSNYKSLTGSSKFNWGITGSTNWRWNVLPSQKNGYVKVRNVKIWNYAMALTNPTTFVVPTNNLPTESVDCRQFSKTKGTVSTYSQTIPSATTNGTALQCSTDTNSIYRYDSNNIFKYNDNNAASDWDPSWNNYSGYNCGTRTNMGIITVKPTDTSTVLCQDNNQYYRYIRGENKLYKYADSVIAAQYGNPLPTTPTTCNFYSTGDFISYLTIPSTGIQEGSDIKCYDKDFTKTYRYTNGKLIPYPSDSSIASSWGSNLNNYKVYNCGSVYPITTNTLNLKPSDGTTIRCSGKYYRYNNTENKLYEYPNNATAIQYGGTLPTTDSNCNQYIIESSSAFVPTTLASSDTTGTVFKCKGNTTDFFRWKNGKLMKYKDAATARGWYSDADTNYKTYNCDGMTPTVTIDTKPAEGSAFKCNDNKKFYRYNDTQKKITLYDSTGVLTQYGITNYSNTELDCDIFDSKDIFQPTQRLADAPDDTSLKCNLGQDILYRKMNGNLYKYPTNEDAIKSWDTNALTGFKAYDCGTTQPTMTLGRKPNNESTIRCLSDNNYYRYNNAENKLYKYPNEATATQYGTEILRGDTDCSQFNPTKPMFVPTALVNTALEGTTLKCKGNTADLFRWTNGKLMKYKDVNAAKSWYNDAETAYTSYNCDGVVVSGTMENKPADGAAFKCRSDKKYYKYNAAQNNLTLYDNEAILRQYGITNYSNTEVDCNQFGTVNVFQPTQSLADAPDGTPLKCLKTDQDTIYRKMNNTIYKYPNDAAIVNSWDSTALTGYKAYDCGTTTTNQTLAAKNTTTVKCSDNKFYKYNITDNKLLLYEDNKIAEQYGGTLPTATTNCDAYQKGNFTAYDTIPSSGIQEGSTIKCYDIDRTKVYRFMNGNLIPYPSDANAVATSWGSDLNNYRVYNCGNVYPVSSNALGTKPADGTTIKCSSDNNYYRFNSTTNKISKYASEAVARQYGGTLPTTTTNCDRFAKDTDYSSYTQAGRAQEGATIKCSDKDISKTYRYTNGILIPYPSDSTANAVATSWGVDLNNYNTYTCGSVTTATNIMETKPANNTTIKCSGKYYNYINTENKLYQYPNNATALQYGGSLPTTDKNCNQYILDPSSAFVPNMRLDIPVPEGTTLKCKGNTTDLFRWTNRKLMKYKDVNAARSWYADADTSYNSYDCDGVAVSGTMENKPADGAAFKCIDNKKFYKYDAAKNKITLYDSSAVLVQYGTTNYSNTEVDCNQFNSTRDVFQPTQSVANAPEGTSLKCKLDQDTIYRKMNGKIYSYPSDDPSIATSWDSSALTGFKAYDCGTTASSGVMRRKGNDGVTLKCSDNNYYRYDNQENKLLKYENTTIAQQYGGTLPTETTPNCDQFVNANFIDFPSKFLEINPATITDGQSLKCDTTGKVYRYNKGNDMIFHYPNEAVAGQWDANWLNYKMYNCGTRSKTLQMDEKPAPGRLIRCTNDSNKLYKYNADNSLSFYPNVSTFIQDNPGWNQGTQPILNRDCRQFSTTRTGFTSSKAFNANDGESVVCNENNVNVSSSTVYRYNKPKNALFTYPNDEVGNSWNATWGTYNSYTCDTNLTANAKPMNKKHTNDINNRVVQCTHNNAWYEYNPDTNTATKYPSRAVISQHFPGYDGVSFVSEDCSYYNLVDDAAKTQSIPDNTPVRFEGEQSPYHLYKDNQTHKYPNADFARSNTPDPTFKTMTADRGLTSVGTDMNWPLNNYDILTCNSGNNYNPSDYYAYKTGTGNGNITKYAGQEDQTQKDILKGWVGNTTPNNFYNCNTLFGNTPSSTKPIPTKDDIIRCENRTDKKTYTKVNAGGQALNAVTGMDSSSNYFKFNKTTNKFERYAADQVLASVNSNYTTAAKSFDDCYMLNKNEEDTVITYPLPADKTIINCTNQSAASFPYYLYDASKNQLNKFPIRNVAERYDPAYLSKAVNYNCSYINATVGSDLVYPAPIPGSVINCSNEASNTYPNYFYDSTSNKLNKFPTEDVLKSWDISEPVKSYDCNYLLIDKGPIKGYKPPIDTSTVKCTNKTDVSFPYYKYDANNNSLNRYKDLTALFTWSPLNVDLDTNTVKNVTSYDCTYLSQQFGSEINNKPFSDATNVQCSNETTNPPQLYRYDGQMLRPYTPESKASWGATLQNVADCSNLTKGPPMYDKSMEEKYSYTLNPFIEINRKGQLSYFQLDNTDDKCNPMPQNYTNINNNPTDYDKYYSRDKYVELYSNDSCTTRASNDPGITTETKSPFNIGTLKYNEGQNSLYYKLTNTKR